MLSFINTIAKTFYILFWWIACMLNAFWNMQSCCCDFFKNFVDRILLLHKHKICVRVFFNRILLYAIYIFGFLLQSIFLGFKYYLIMDWKLIITKLIKWIKKVNITIFFLKEISLCYILKFSLRYNKINSVCSLYNNNAILYFDVFI